MSLGSSQNQATDEQQPNSGFSEQRAFLIEIISEGPCTGVIEGLKNVYFDDTVVENADGSRNYSGFYFKQRRGYMDQSPLGGNIFGESAATYQVNTVIKQTTGPVTRTVINPELDAIRLTLQLQLYKGNGNEETGIEFTIETKRGSNPWKLRKTEEIRGIYRDPVALEYEFSFANLGASIDEYSIRITRLSEDVDDEPDRLKILRWVNYQEIIRDSIPYSGTAHVGLQFDAKNFSSIPSRKYKFGGIHGLVPHTMSVRESDRGLDYIPDPVSGQQQIFNGSFYRYPYHNSCPMSLLLELLTNKRFNARPMKIAKMDVYSIYAIMQRNNSFLPDGRGGFHRRYAFNYQIQSKERTRDLIESICATMHVKPIEQRGKISFWQDKPDVVAWTFTNVDVEDGRFTYSETEHRRKFNACRVNYYDPNNKGEPISELVDDGEAIEKWRGVNQTDITVLGCDDRFRAIRAGRWAIFSSFYENEFISFNARAFASLVRLGDVVEVLDNNTLPYRNGGLVERCNPDRVTILLDNNIRITTQSFLKCMLPNGSIEQRLVSNPIGYTGRLLTLATPFSQVIPPEFSWMLVNSQAVPTKWRVTGIKPTPQDPTKITIVGIRYLDGKWDYIDKEEPLETAVGMISQAVAVTRVNAINTTVNANNNVYVTVVFPSDVLVSSAIVEYSRVDSGVWVSMGLFPRSSPSKYTTQPGQNALPSGNYRFRATAIDFRGRYSSYFYKPTLTEIP